MPTYARYLDRTIALSLLVTMSLLAGCSPGDGTAAHQEDGGAEARIAAPPAFLSVIDEEGAAVGGAMITADLAGGLRRTVFSASDGRAALALLDAAGPVTISAPGLASTTVADPAGKTVTLRRDPDYLLALPSAHWLALLPEGDRKREFTVNCATCHEIGFDRIMIDGRARTRDEWLAAFAMMRAMDVYEVIPPDFDDEAYATWLAGHLTGDRIRTLSARPHGDADLLSGIIITEYPLPEADALPHDLVIGPDGRIWITAFFYDQLWALDPASGAIDTFPIDDRPGINAQPRALEFDANGLLWVVNGGTEMVVRFDPATGDYTEIPVGMYAHSIDLDADGDIWVNDYFAEKERVARVDADTLQVTVYPVPQAGRPSSEGLPLPYGLQVDGQGRLFSTQLAASTLVMVDTASGAGELFDMPVANAGPRRPGLAPDGRLWIPEFNTGYLSAFEPESRRFERVQLGSSSLGLYDAEVNQANGEVWVTGSLASSLIRLRPESGAILHVPLPTEPAYTRHIAVDESSGDVWSAYSSLPAATPRVVRLQFVNEG
jgi:virginiamycin B lyase